MKKAAKTIVSLLLFLAVLPGLAGLAVTALWNSLIPSLCGFAAISFWQGVGLFFLGQFLTGGFLLVMILGIGGLHAIFHHPDELKAHLHFMTGDQRREFINRRRAHFRSFKTGHEFTDAGE